MVVCQETREVSLKHIFLNEKLKVLSLVLFAIDEELGQIAYLLNNVNVVVIGQSVHLFKEVNQ